MRISPKLTRSVSLSKRRTIQRFSATPDRATLKRHSSFQANFGLDLPVLHCPALLTAPPESGAAATIAALSACQAGGGKVSATNMCDREGRCGGKGRGRDVRHAPGPCSRRPLTRTRSRCSASLRRSDRHGASSPIGGRRIPVAIPDSRAGVGIELAEDGAAFLSVPMAGGSAADLGWPPLRVEGSRNVESALGRGSCQVNQRAWHWPRPARSLPA
jgi:hypothetical protein